MAVNVLSHDAFSLDSQQEELFWWDDFEGSVLKDEWHVTGTGSCAVVDLQYGGIARLTTGAVINNNYTLYWNDKRSMHVSNECKMEVRCKLNQITNMILRISLYFDGNNCILFEYDSSVLANWRLRCFDGGAGTSVDSGEAADTSNHIFRILTHPSDQHVAAVHAHFFIDDLTTEVTNSPISTNIPDDAADYLQPLIFIQTLENAAKTADSDYVGLGQLI